MVDLSGVQITQFAATPYVFADGVTLPPGEYIVIARNPTALVSIHGEQFNLAPDGFANRNRDSFFCRTIFSHLRPPIVMSGYRSNLK